MQGRVSIERKITIGLVVSLSILILVSYLSYRNTKRLIEQSIWVDHTHQVLEKLDHILYILREGQANTRGYVITNEERYLNPYPDEELLKTEIGELKKLTADNPVQQRLIQKFEPLALELMGIMKNVIAARKSSGFDSAASLIMTDKPRTNMVEVRRIISEMRDHETDLLTKRSFLHQTTSEQVIWIIGVSSLLAFVFVSVASLIIHRDMRSRTLAQEETSRLNDFLNSILENIPNMVFVKDAKDLRFVRFNKAAETMLGFPRESFIGKNDYDFFPPEEADFFIAKDRAVLDSGRMQDIPEESIHTASKEMKFLHTKKLPIIAPNGDPLFLLGISEDITERKKADETVRQLNHQLQKRLDEVTELNHELESFSYSISHDLRAPLRHIHGFADILNKNAAAQLDEKNKRHLNIINQSARRMGQLIDDLLVFSRMGRAEMKKSKVDLNSLVKSVLEDLHAETEGRSIQWTIQALPDVDGDPAMLRQVIFNLLSNAIKYSGRREEAQIEIGYQDNDQQDHLFFVRDNGVGFDMKYAYKLFGVFQRLHHINEFEGTGIGLANIRRIISRHGGKTWAEAAVDEGATFYFSLPKEEVTNDD